MPGKKQKKSQNIESDDSEAQPLQRGTKKIVKKKSQPEQKSKPQKSTPQKTQKGKSQPAKQQPKGKSKQPTETKAKDDKKSYLPGQRHPTPPDTDGAKAFYLSLLEQCPNNGMAEKWCLDYGCLDYQDAMQRVKKYEKNKR